MTRIMENCIFCKIINKEAESFILFENEYVSVFLSLENHPLVVTKKHIPNILELDNKIGAEVMNALIKISKITKKVFESEGIYIVQANGESAGQSVFHAHFHVVPTWLNAPINLRSPVSIEERRKTVEKISQFL